MSLFIPKPTSAFPLGYRSSMISTARKGNGSTFKCLSSLEVTGFNVVPKVFLKITSIGPTVSGKFSFLPFSNAWWTEWAKGRHPRVKPYFNQHRGLTRKLERKLVLFNPCQKCTLWNSDPPTSVIFLPFLYLVVLKFNDKTWVKRKWGQVIKINKTHQFTGDKRETSPVGVMKKAVGKIGQLRSMRIPRMAFMDLVYQDWL